MSNAELVIYDLPRIVKDVETLLQTDAAKLVGIAGADAHMVKREAVEILKKSKEK